MNFIFYLLQKVIKICNAKHFCLCHCRVCVRFLCIIIVYCIRMLFFALPIRLYSPRNRAVWIPHSWLFSIHSHIDTLPKETILHKRLRHILFLFSYHLFFVKITFNLIKQPIFLLWCRRDTVHQPPLFVEQQVCRKLFYI